MSDDKSRIHALFGAPPPAAPQTAAANVQGTPAASAASPAGPAARSTPARPPLRLGTIDVPTQLETRHILAVGTTGSGKSQALYTGVLSPIRERDDPAIIIDHSAEFLQRYYRKDVDLIFNPFDERSVGWSPFNEIRRVYDFDRIARAIVPDVAGENQDWQIGAQQLLANAMRGLWQMGKLFRANEPLLWFLTEAPTHGLEPSKTGLPTTLQGLLQGSTSQRLFEKGNEKQLVVTLGILGRHLQPLTYLKDGDFSMTDYVKQFEEPGKCHSWLFLSYTDASYSAIGPLFSILVSCGIQSSLELSENPHSRRFYYVLDEFSSLEKIDAVDDALTKMRKRGGVVVAGIQSTAQLEEKNGETGAQILLSCFGNVLMLRVADDKTAEKLSAMIGDIETWETTTNTGKSDSDSGVSISEGTSRHKTVKRLVLGSQFMTLPDLNGYVRIAGTPQVNKTVVPISKLPVIAKAEETRATVYLDLA